MKRVYYKNGNWIDCVDGITWEYENDANWDRTVNMNICEYCESPTENEKDSDANYRLLCNDCFNLYDNKTGFCSLDCCVSGKCDESC